MIVIEITHSPDLLSTGTREFYLHHITMGKSLKNTIPVNDPDLTKEHLELRCTSKGLIIECNQPFFLNDKQVQGILLLQKGDVVQVGSTVFKISEVNLNEIVDTDQYYEFLERVEKEEPLLYDVISTLENEYINITTEKMNELD